MNGPTPLSAQEIGAHFQVASAVPATVLVTFVAAIVASGAPADAPELSRVAHAASHLDLVDIGLLALAAVAVALVLHPFQVAVVKGLEGYRPSTGPFAWIHRWGQQRHEARYDKLSEIAAPVPKESSLSNDERARTELRARRADDVLASLPLPGRLMPTSLGNVLRFAEDFSGNRYGLDAVEAIPRMMPLMPASMTAYINDARTQMDLMASFVLVWLIATVASLSAFIQHGAWILVALGTYGLAWLAYRGCVASAGSYGRALIWAMDLFRFDLYEQLRLPLPRTLLIELEDGPRLMELLEGQWAQDPDLMPRLNPTYEHPSRAAAGGDGPAA